MHVLVLSIWLANAICCWSQDDVGGKLPFVDFDPFRRAQFNFSVQLAFLLVFSIAIGALCLIPLQLLHSLQHRFHLVFEVSVVDDGFR